MSRAFEATGRFTTEFGVELLAHPSRAFVANLRNSEGQPPRVFTGDIRKLTDNRTTLSQELRAAGLTNLDDIDVIAGGPPCNGFSRNGVRKYVDSEKGVRFYDDPRNHLYKDFLDVCEFIKPKVVLVENVREFLNYDSGKFSQDLISTFEEWGYDVAFQKLCAADFGVPQMRHRVFFLAVRKDVCDVVGRGPSFPKAEFFPAAGDLFGNSRRYRTVRDAIGDLPEPSTVRGLSPLQYITMSDLSDYAFSMRSASGSVTNHVARVLSGKQVERINAVGTGRMREIDSRLQTNKFYGSAYGRLDWDEPSLTITTWVYHVGSGRFAHPVADRGLTMREAARLQSFDDSFVFPPLVNPVSQMIGNAVPPLLAKSIAQEVYSILDLHSEKRIAA
ncbi:DNA cytosine methyltransferase [Rhodobacter capsulatus]|uniref:Cytosine-specific methyltransferase n=1 Tax=Rhodobacter capsulatus TaxID=1061 RepID=A0A4V5PQ45_RHOCA|nr:DNA cytosine methyltransferase [Rhodobacter capsulatus]TKD25121.1 DNA cytosine methyltransferase [Rhodobacter capsulatus]